MGKIEEIITDGRFGIVPDSDLPCAPLSKSASTANDSRVPKATILEEWTRSPNGIIVLNLGYIRHAIAMIGTTPNSSA